MIRRPFVVAFLVVLDLAVLAVAIVLFSNYVASTPEPFVQPTPFAKPSFDPSAVKTREPPPPRKLTPDAPCTPIHFAFDGGPRKFYVEHLGRYRVPAGRMWKLTNAVVMMERHYGGANTVAGEWTGVIGGKVRGMNVGFAVSSLDAGSGIALQGSGRISATLPPKSHLIFSIWLRPYTEDSAGTRVRTDRTNYYYGLTLSGMDCPASA